MNDTEEKLGAHEVAAWLRRHPGFLKQFPDLALTLVVPRDDGPTASLASYQLEVLRDKNRELSKRLRDLYAISQENERLAVRTHQLTLALTTRLVRGIDGRADAADALTPDQIAQGRGAREAFARARVAALIGPQLSGAVKEWLAGVCKPL